MYTHTRPLRSGRDRPWHAPCPEFPGAPARWACPRSSLARRTSSRGRRSGCRFPRCGPGRARRCDAGSGGRRCRRIPAESRKATSFAPAASAACVAVRLQLRGESAAGIQYRRMNSPMTVPGPTRVRSVLSCALGMPLPRCMPRWMVRPGDFPGQCTGSREQTRRRVIPARRRHSITGRIGYTGLLSAGRQTHLRVIPGRGKVKVGAVLPSR